MTNSLKLYKIQAIWTKFFYPLTFSRQVFVILLILAGAFFLQKAVVVFIKKIIGQLKLKIGSDAYQKRIDTIVGVIANASGIIIYLVALMMVLSELGLNIAPLITGAGIAGLAFGFGAQTLVKDFISGFFILLENQFNQGDVIQAAGKTGKVKQVGLRTTLLVDTDGSQHLIPNSQLGVITIIKEKSQV